jgi:hypothetical protein
MSLINTNRKKSGHMRGGILVVLTLFTWSGLQLFVPGAVNDVSAAGSVESEEPTCITERFDTVSRGVAWASKDHSKPPQLTRYMRQNVLTQPTRGYGTVSQYRFDEVSHWVSAAIPAPLRAQSCSLLEITHLGIGYEQLERGGALYVQSLLASGWASLSPVIDTETFGYPMCRRGVKRGDDKGPSPWGDAEKLVRVGPPEEVIQPIAAQTYDRVVPPVVASTASPPESSQDESSLHEPAHSAPQADQAAAAPTNPQTNGETQTVAYSPAATRGYGALNPGYWATTPLPIEGLAMYYNPGVMDQVVEYRERMGEIDGCPECVGFAALLRAGDLNRKIWIQWEDGTVEGPFLVADVAARHHVDMLIRRGWAVDVDNETAVRQGMLMPVPVTVHGAPPAAE